MVNSPTTPIKRQCQDKKKKKQASTIRSLEEKYFKYKDTDGLKVKLWRKIYHTNTKHKKTCVSVLM